MEITPAIRAALTRDAYLNYLNSEAWRARRNRKLRTVKWRCEACNSKRDLQVHHRSYAHLGHESDDELKVLCANCHRSEHLERPDQTSLGLYLKLASEAVAVNPWSTIADLSETVKLRCVELKIPLLPERIKSALAVVCGRLKSVPGSAKSRRLDSLRPHDEYGPATKEEARDFFYRMDTSLGGNLSAFMASKSMPSVYTTTEAQQIHEEHLRQQIQEMRRPHVPKKIATMDRLKEIFGEA